MLFLRKYRERVIVGSSGKEDGESKTYQASHLDAQTVTPDGRVQYYDKERFAKNPGPTRGNSLVTEYNPKTGGVKQWMESYDHNGNVNRVHPKSVNGQVVDSIHYPPRGAELEKMKK